MSDWRWGPSMRPRRCPLFAALVVSTVARPVGPGYVGTASLVSQIFGWCLALLCPWNPEAPPNSAAGQSNAVRRVFWERVFRCGRAGCLQTSY